MDINQFGNEVVQLLNRGDWNNLISRLHGINVPEEWHDMVKPIFTEFMGKDLQCDIISIDELPEEQRQSISHAPEEVLEHTRFGLKLWFDHSVGDEQDDGVLQLPIYNHDGLPVILLVG